MLSDWPAEKPVNGQHPYAGHVVELPMRAGRWSLHFTPALIPRTAEVAKDYLPLTRENLIRQSFKFLGERYGWVTPKRARLQRLRVGGLSRFGVQCREHARSGRSGAHRMRIPDDDDREKRLKCCARCRSAI